MTVIKKNTLHAVDQLYYKTLSQNGVLCYSSNGAKIISEHPYCLRYLTFLLMFRLLLATHILLFLQDRHENIQKPGSLYENFNNLTFMQVGNCWKCLLNKVFTS